MHRIDSGMAGCPSYVWWDYGRTNERGSRPVRIAIGGKITKSLDALKKEGLKSRNSREYLAMLPLEYLPGEDIYFRIIYSDGTVHQKLFDAYAHEAISIEQESPDSLPGGSTITQSIANSIKDYIDDMVGEELDEIVVNFGEIGATTDEGGKRNIEKGTCVGLSVKVRS